MSNFLLDSIIFALLWSTIKNDKVLRNDFNLTQVNAECKLPNCLNCLEDLCISCEKGFYLDEGYCEKCDWGCTSCQNSSSFCTGCLEGFTFENNNCISVCLDEEKKQYWDKDKKKCEDCHRSCFICKGPGKKDCIDCILFEVDLIDGECILNDDIRNLMLVIIEPTFFSISFILIIVYIVIKRRKKKRKESEGHVISPYKKEESLLETFPKKDVSEESQEIINSYSEKKDGRFDLI
jgi:hypothetical protein